MMLGEPARCATHKTVLTSAGTCLLCRPKPRHTLVWVTGAVVGGLFVLAVVFKIYLAISDHHPAQAATAEPASTTGALAPLPTMVTTPNDRASLLADARRDVVIDLYGASWCPHCVRARSFLDREGIAYAYHDVDQAANKPALRQLNPRGGIPTIKVDDEVIVGFSEGHVRRAINRSAEIRVANRGR